MSAGQGEDAAAQGPRADALGISRPGEAPPDRGGRGEWKAAPPHTQSPLKISPVPPVAATSPSPKISA